MSPEESESLIVGDIITNSKSHRSFKVVGINPIPEDRHLSYDLELLNDGEYDFIETSFHRVFAIWLCKNEWIKEGKDYVCE